MLGIYSFYRTYAIEWIIYSILIANGLYTLSSQNRKIKHWIYLLLNGISYACLVPVILAIPYLSLFQTQGAAIWAFFAAMILVSLGFAAFFLRRDLLTLCVYDIFYCVFLLLMKMVLSPFYSAEATMAPERYAFFDSLLLLLQPLMIIAITVLFNKVKISIHLSYLPKTYPLAMLIPLGVFAFFFIYVSGIPISPSIQLALISAVLLAAMPIFYYIFASVIQSYTERMRLDRALLNTQMELSNYRYAIELDEKIKQERHELKNNYFYIHMLLKEGKYEKIDAYLSDVIGEKLTSLEHISTGNPMLDHILNEAVTKAHELKIPVCTEIVVRKDLPVREDALCTILLNLLHNAIEASQQTTDPDLRISIREAQNYLVCKIANKTDFDVLAENPTLSTTKQDKANHGLGLKIVSLKVKEENGTIDTTVKDGYFTSTVMLPLVIAESVVPQY